MILLKRIYESYSKEDGFRVLVDRLWPRGISKEKAKIDLWLKEIGPSTELRKWFGHEVEKWPEFQKRYKQELRTNKFPLEELKNLAKKNEKLTLLYGAKDKERNQAAVLVQMLMK